MALIIPRWKGDCSVSSAAQTGLCDYRSFNLTIASEDIEITSVGQRYYDIELLCWS